MRLDVLSQLGMACDIYIKATPLNLLEA